MSIAARFRAALGDVDDADLAGPELLPVRLCRACARTLGVDGAGMSVLDRDGRRIPLGASSETAGTAERLQFTAGSGPCQSAQENREPVFATFADLQRRWPAFAGLLAEHTPYRAVVALPIGETLTGPGALDLFFVDDATVTDLDVFEAMAVGGLVTSVLGEAAVWAPWSPQGGPAWLHGPAARRRATVWTAMGRLAMALDTDGLIALDLLRGAAWTADRSVDDLAEDVVAGRLDPAALRPREDGP
ncbi:GAF domain-containing protein [Geodermatophilus sp. TF02-6]|uniref:GAF domain-containing protein n=1 Tax=Geodermatophilus sp. TF02-6 TaxID=2250575 RepID=UPI000DE8110D|nr:GAF domain-containing protein [Geodermatophilus sp. TF02-6]RBY79504.1 GAF domain-containing protein [Geodermatophilus sp. TF02-6]